MSSDVGYRLTNRAALKVAREQGHDMRRIPGTQDGPGNVTYTCWRDGCEALMRIEDYRAEDAYGWMKPCPTGGDA